MKPTMFDILKNLNDLDTEDKGSRVGVCPHFVSSQLSKAGTQVTMGAPSDASTQLLSGSHIPILVLIDKEQYNKVKSELEKQ